jgi:hypothetical protein
MAWPDDVNLLRGCISANIGEKRIIVLFVVSNEDGPEANTEKIQCSLVTKIQDKVYLTFQVLTAV